MYSGSMKGSLMATTSTSSRVRIDLRAAAESAGGGGKRRRHTRGRRREERKRAVPASARARNHGLLAACGRRHPEGSNCAGSTHRGCVISSCGGGGVCGRTKRAGTPHEPRACPLQQAFRTAQPHVRHPSAASPMHQAPDAAVTCGSTTQIGRSGAARRR
eukprot:293153-Chlamydomonas_euryale.AAC.5